MTIILNNIKDYTEEIQQNPINWSILSREDENIFEQVTGWFRCKDFFNDVCSAYNGGPKFKIYGFDTNYLKLPNKKENLFVAVTGLLDFFISNLKTFNSWLADNKYPELSYISDDEIILEIPSFYLENTYNISLLTLIVRILNSDIKFKSFEEILKYRDFCYKDQILFDQMVNAGIVFKQSKYIWFTTEKINSGTEETVPPYNLPTYIHNSGCITWIKNVR